MAKEKNAALTSIADQLRKHETVQIGKMSKGDVKAGRIANAIQNDLLSLDRIAKRLENDYYAQ